MKNYSYNEFLKVLNLVDSELVKTIYHLYLDCLIEDSKNK